MIEIKSTTVRLGEKDYEIREAGFIVSKPWKKRLIDEIKPLFEVLNGAGEIEFNSPADLVKLLPLAENVFVEGIETIFELLMAYAPAVASDREYIAQHATDRQIVAAFREVVYLADPFGVVTQLNRQLGRGLTGTLSNSPSASGG